ncbi:hypothetical protein [Streptomyces sp. NPDC001020]
MAEAAHGTFLPEVVSTPELPEAVHRLMEGRQGFAGMLSSGIRADRKLVARLTHSGSWRGELYDKLPLADAWCTAHRKLRALTSTHAELIGRYRGTALPDVPALRKALVHAEAVHALAPETVTDPHRRSLLAAHLTDAPTTGAASARHLPGTSSPSARRSCDANSPNRSPRPSPS